MPVTSHFVPRLLCVVAAPPDLIRMAPVLAALRQCAPAPALTLLHTGQHEDAAMHSQLCAALDLPRPDIALDVGTANYAVQTAEVMRRFDTVLEQQATDAIVLVGDRNATLACALVAAKRHVPVLHIEAGLRSFDRSMPEELNRVLTDQLSELLFTTEAAATDNLQREGIASSRIHLVGNVLIDTLLRLSPSAPPTAHVLARCNLAGFFPPGSPYALLTLDRPGNVDDPRRLRALLEVAGRLSARLPVLLPLHPRTRARVRQFDMGGLLDQPGLACLPPLGYLDLVGLMRDARMVLTDSSGVQDETTALGIPCLTLRDHTERPITISEGTNALAGRDPAVILALCDDILHYGGKAGRVPQHWDGQAAPRIAAIVGQWLAQRLERAP